MKSDLRRQPGSDQIQIRLILLAVVSLLLAGAVLTLAPAARARSWQADYHWEHWLGVGIWLVVLLGAHFATRRHLPERDPFLLPIAALLSGWGLLTIWRLLPEFGLRQSFWLLISGGVLIAGVVFPFDPAILRRFKYLWLTGGLLLTVITLIFGTNPLGAGPRMWLGCCGIYFQPSEPLKLLLIIYLSAYLAGFHPTRPDTPPGPAKTQASNPLLPLLSPSLLMTGLALAVLLVQRDLGTASIFVFLFTILVYHATGRNFILVAGAVTLVLAGLAGFTLFDVVRLRVEAWLNPWLDPSGRSYQIVQSLISAASGGLLGRGLGMGSPGLVPVAHSDFIFTAVVEENGLVGAIALLLVYGLLAARGLRIALRAADTFQRNLAVGISAHLVAQAILIMGGNLRLLPLTGVTLPFVSYGGSSLLTSFLSLLLLLKISAVENTDEFDRHPHPHKLLPLIGLLLAGLLGVALAAGWWTFYRGPSLLTRTDNPRRALADRDVPRGAILDRNNQPIAVTAGVSGSYARQLLAPSLSPVVGYNSEIFGQAGLEAAYDGYLRGLEGYPGMVLWWNHILYGQPPPGLDVRLSLDLRLQAVADEALQGHTGALVLLHANSGEILAMASHPGYDANLLEQNWQDLVSDARSPLLNRAVDGRYPAQALLDSLFAGMDRDLLSAIPTQIDPGTESSPPAGDLVLSPLQAALGAAALSNMGLRPAAGLASAVNTPTGGWVILTTTEGGAQLFSAEQAAARQSVYRLSGEAIWQFTASTQQGAPAGVWYLAGSDSDWQAAPFALALVLEENDPELAIQIGQQVLRAAMFP